MENTESQGNTDVIEQVFAITDILSGLVTEILGAIIIGIIILSRKRIMSTYQQIKFHGFDNRNLHFERLGKHNLCPNIVPRSSLESSMFFGSIQPPTTFGKFDNQRKIIVDVSTDKVDRRLAKQIPDRVVPFEVTIKSGYAKDSSEFESATAASIAHKIFLSSINAPKPELVIIDGKIGCGKTTLITQLGAALHSLNSGDKNSPQILSIHIDIREKLQAKIESSPKLNQDITGEYLVDEIKTVLEYNIRSALRDASVFLPDTAIGFEDLIMACYALNISPVIFVDELDYLYYDFAKRVTSLNGKPDERIIRSYHALVNFLFNFHQKYCPINRKLGVHSNTVIVLAARTNSYKFFRELDDASSLAFTNRTHNLSGENKLFNQHRISINNPSPIRLAEIILKRVNAAIKLLTKVGSDTNSKNALENLRKLKVTIEEEKPCFDKHLNVSVHGMRHIFNILARIHSLDNTAELLYEIIKNPCLFTLYQYLDGNPEYSQANEGVANLFLVNKDFTESKLNGRPEHDGNYESVLFKEHLQTYWLKYFMMQLVAVKSKGSSDAAKNWIDSAVVQDVFCHSKNGCSAFEDSIVNLTLLNLFEVDSGRLLKFKYDGQLRIRPTNRFLFMNKNDLYWSFEYLCLIIEDSWLKFPNSIVSDFTIKTVHHRTYNFVTNFFNLTNNEKLKFIQYKAELVLKFIYLLEVSYKEESLLYKSVFIRLKQLGVTVPCFEEIISSLEQQIRQFTIDNVSQSSERIIDKTIDDTAKDKVRYQKIIRQLYRKYYCKRKGFPYKTEKKLAIHHNAI